MFGYITLDAKVLSSVKAGMLTRQGWIAVCDTRGVVQHDVALGVLYSTR